MIKFEHTVTASPEQMDFIIEGMRNPLDSWEKSDSFTNYGIDSIEYVIGNNDKNLMDRLDKAGVEHRKFMRMLPVYVRITAPLYWWKEFDTYKIGTVRNSCSTMHTLHKKGVTPDAFSHEWIDEVGDIYIHERCPFADKDVGHTSVRHVYNIYLDTIEALRLKFNETKEKKYWYAMIQMLPEGFMMTANVMLNYEVVLNQRKQRKHHKQEEWSGQDGFVEWSKKLPHQFLFDALEE